MVALGQPDARAVETDLHNPAGRHVDQLDVAAIGLNGRANEVDDALDFLAQRRGVGGFTGGWVPESCVKPHLGEPSSAPAV